MSNPERTTLAVADELERLRRIEEAARAFLADERYVPGYPAELRLRKALGPDKQDDLAVRVAALEQAAEALSTIATIAEDANRPYPRLEIIAIAEAALAALDEQEPRT